MFYAQLAIVTNLCWCGMRQCVQLWNYRVNEDPISMKVNFLHTDTLVFWRGPSHKHAWNFTLPTNASERNVFIFSLRVLLFWQSFFEVDLVLLSQELQTITDIQQKSHSDFLSRSDKILWTLVSFARWTMLKPRGHFFLWKPLCTLQGHHTFSPSKVWMFSDCWTISPEFLWVVLPFVVIIIFVTDPPPPHWSTDARAASTLIRGLDPPEVHLAIPGNLWAKWSTLCVTDTSVIKTETPLFEITAIIH